MDDWMKNFVRKCKEKTFCNHEEAIKIAGWVSEIKQSEYLSGHSRGYNQGFKDGKERDRSYDP